MDYIVQTRCLRKSTLSLRPLIPANALRDYIHPWAPRSGKRTRLTVIGSPILQTFCRRNLRIQNNGLDI